MALLLTGNAMEAAISVVAMFLEIFAFIPLFTVMTP
ncbi:hypothetical protein J2747_001198 [Thermococcus stetteri]|nr:hypothetical protein [Thermococcus stetteri]